jgi:hypothetical protein
MFLQILRSLIDSSLALLEFGQQTGFALLGFVVSTPPFGYCYFGTKQSTYFQSVSPSAPILRRFGLPQLAN